MKLLKLIILICFISCKQNKTRQNISTKTNSTENQLTKLDSCNKKHKKVVEKIEKISINFNRDTIFFKNQEMFCIDNPIEKGFIRKYYCKNKIISSLIVKNNKILKGIYIEGLIIDNIIQDDFELFEYHNGKKQGVYVYFSMGPEAYGLYHKGVKSGKWIQLFTNGKWSGIIDIETFKKGKQVKRLSDYYDWNEMASKFLNTEEAKPIKEFIYCLYGNNLYKN